MTDRLERIRAEHMDWNCDARDKEDVAYLLQELDAERRRADRLITGQVIESDCIDSQGVVHPCPWEVSRVACR